MKWMRVQNLNVWSTTHYEHNNDSAPLNGFVQVGFPTFRLQCSSSRIFVCVDKGCGMVNPMQIKE